MMSLSSPPPPIPSFDSYPVAPAHHLTLPPTSTFFSPFDTPATITAHLNSDNSPATSLKQSPTLSIFSSGDLGSPSRHEGLVQRAYIASKASVDLIRVLDLQAMPEMPGIQPSDPGPGNGQSDNVPPVPPTTPVTSTSTVGGSKEARGVSQSIESSMVGAAPPRALNQPSSRSPVLNNDRSFLRMSTTTASHSDFAPPLDIPLKSLSIASGEDEGDKSSRRSSGGTFGRARRWSVSTGSVVDATGSFRGAKQASETFLSDNEGEGDDASMTSSQRRRRRRHQSLSSTTSTSVSGQTGPMSSEVIAIHNSKGLFPSPTQPKRTHRKPESDAAITAHLLKTASRDPRKIVPALGGALSPPIQLHPPSSGTPLKSGLVDEESGVASDDDGETPPRKRDPLKTRSKIEQLLGDGAVAAGAQMEYERQAWRAALQMIQESPAGPVPPYRGHRATHSSPNAPVSPQSIFSEHHTPRHGHHPSEPLDVHFQTRSGSYESIPSLHPSIADSLTQLIPPNHPHSPTAYKANMKALPTTPRGPTRSKMEDVSPGEESSAEEKRAQLQRRLRALEKRLGERLIDDGTGKLIIKPAEGTTTILADVPDFWPPTPTSSTPEWARDDVVPRTVPVPKGTVIEPNTLGKKTKLRPRDQDKDSVAGDLKIYVGRQTQVAQSTSAAGMTSPINRQNSDKGLTWTSPQESGDGTKGHSYDPTDEDAIMANNRRRQLVKLQKLLGEVLTPTYLLPSLTSLDSRPDSPLSHPLSRQTLTRMDSPHSDQTSFIDMSIDDLSYPMIKSSTPPREGGSILKGPWASKLKQSMSISSGKGKRVVGDDESYVSFGSGRGGGTWGKLNSLNGAIGRHNKVRSSDSPLPSESNKPTPLGDSRWNASDQSTPSRGSYNQAPQSKADQSSYDDYKQSFQGLLYLAENNPSQLVRLVDSLEDATADTVPSRRPSRPDRDSPSPPSPVLKSPTCPPEESYFPVIDPNSEEARRRRVGKLSNFFGEGLDFTSPSVPLRQAIRYDTDLTSPVPTRESMSRSTSGLGRRGKSRLDVLDGMLGELWRGVQSDLKVGAMRGDEADQLGELFGAYKRRRENMKGWEQL